MNCITDSYSIANNIIHQRLKQSGKQSVSFWNPANKEEAPTNQSNGLPTVMQANTYYKIFYHYRCFPAIKKMGKDGTFVCKNIAGII